MANTKISQLTSGTPAQALDEFRIARPDGLGGYDDFELKIQDVSAYVDTDLSPLKTSQLGAASGVAPLNGASQVPVANLPYSAIAYQGTWNAATNAPSIASGVGINGEFYWVSVAGATVIDGNGPWSVGDVIVFNGTTVAWEQATMGTSSPGPIGPPGADGKTILSGAVNPTGGTGVNGDFYINTVTNFIFGPKTGGVWPAGVSLVGPAGINGINGINGAPGTPGINGNTILSGTGAPNNALGVNGDFYLDTQNTILYGPKGGGVWPNPGTSLIGPPGLPGTGGASAPNTASYWGAVGNGTFVSVAAAINPLTNAPYGAGGLAAAEARWNLVRERWSIDTFDLAAITAFPVGGTFTITTPGIGSPVVYTVPSTPPSTLSDLAKDIAERVNDSSGGNLALSRSANFVGTTVRVYTKSTNAVTMTKSATVLGLITAARTKIYNNSTINMATDSVDWVALQQLVYLTEANVNANYVEFTAGSTYVLSRALDMPNKTISSTKILTINGNNSTLRPVDIATNAPRKKLIYRDVPAQRYALDGVQSNLPKIQINNIYFRLPFYTTRDLNPETQSTDRKSVV